MLLSMFSHKDLAHLFVNMYCLTSFSSSVHYNLGTKSMLMLYLGAGLSSAITSQLFRVYESSMSCGLGASGAVLGLIVSACLNNPESRLGIMMIPYTIPAKYGFYCILGLDLAGLLLGWKYLDHAGHLGGTLFGVLWTLYGHNLIFDKNNKLSRRKNKRRGL